MRKTSLAFLLFLTALPALAGVYRWVDDKGVVHYSDTPPAPGTKETELPKLQTFSSKSLTQGTPVDGSSPDDSTPPPAAPPYRPVITSPANEATIRETSGEVTVETSTPPGGLGLVYYYDGKAQNPTPTPSTSYLLTGVERGTHTVAVAAVDGGGKEVGRSDTVTFYMKPPTVGMSHPH